MKVQFVLAITLQLTTTVNLRPIDNKPFFPILEFISSLSCDWNGHDAFNKEQDRSAGTAEVCMRLCINEPQCYFYTWKNGVCYMKKKGWLTWCIREFQFQLDDGGVICGCYRH